MACEKGKGVLNVYVDGVTIVLDTDSDLLIFPNDETREERSNGEFVVSEASPYMEGTFRVPVNQKVQTLLRLCNVPVTAELYDGRVFHFQNANQVASEAYNAKENTLLLRFIDVTSQEVR